MCTLGAIPKRRGAMSDPILEELLTVLGRPDADFELRVWTLSELAYELAAPQSRVKLGLEHLVAAGQVRREKRGCCTDTYISTESI